MEDPTPEPHGHTHAGFAPVTVKGKKPEPTRLFAKTGLSQAPQAAHPMSGAAQGLPQLQLHIAVMLKTADVMWKQRFPHKPCSLEAGFHLSAILSSDNKREKFPDIVSPADPHILHMLIWMPDALRALS